ncbi:MAG TPA: trypsin-like peptidase domain-containing protein [Kofleriaceae bacterium]|nr:trypsin-like peptidase domain-containing protein [Kofleriaceae bacterium]
MWAWSPRIVGRLASLAVLGGLCACVGSEPAADTTAQDTSRITATPLASDPSDERIRIEDPARFPFNTVAKVKLGPDGNGRGTGFLVAPCTLLTNGHVVWNGTTNDWRVIASVHPASYYDESIGASVDPYGSRVPSGQATNTSWTASLDPDYDYGAIFISSSFESLGLDTYMPVVFGEEPGFINMSGYPSEDLPDTTAGAAQEQWRGFGDVELYDTRVMYYDATSSGGASGSPVWVLYTSGERSVVSVNRGHSATYEGIGTRFVAANQDLVENWLSRTCGGLAASPAANLLVDGTTLRGAKVERLPAGELNVTEPVHTDQLVRTRSVVQYIEGQVYRWEEYSPPGEAARRVGPDRLAAPRRAIRLTRPEARWLSAAEASLLLSASTLWMKSAAPIAPESDVNGRADLAVEAPAPSGRTPQGPELSIETRSR